MQAAEQVLVLTLPVLLPAFIMQWAALGLEREAVRTLGARPYLLLFAWLGTAVHELGHALFHALFGHRITGMKLFSLDPQSETLGYVRFEFQPGSLRQRLGLFFAGAGPILVGSVLILLAAHFLLPTSQTLSLDAPSPVLRQVGDLSGWLQALPGAAWTLAHSMLQGFAQGGWRLLLFIWLAFSIGSSITLSPADLRLAARGALSLLLLLLVLHGALHLVGAPLKAWVAWLAEGISILPPLLLVVVGLNLLFLVVLKGLRLLLVRFRS